MTTKKPKSSNKNKKSLLNAFRNFNYGTLLKIFISSNLLATPHVQPVDDVNLSLSVQVHATCDQRSRSMQMDRIIFTELKVFDYSLKQHLHNAQNGEEIVLAFNHDSPNL